MEHHRRTRRSRQAQALLESKKWPLDQDVRNDRGDQGENDVIGPIAGPMASLRLKEQLLPKIEAIGEYAQVIQNLAVQYSADKTVGRADTSPNDPRQ